MLNIFNIFRKSNRGDPIIEERTNGLITAPDGYETIIHDANYEEIIDNATNGSYMASYYVDSVFYNNQSLKREALKREQTNNAVETESLSRQINTRAESRRVSSKPMQIPSRNKKSSYTPPVATGMTNRNPVIKVKPELFYKLIPQIAKEAANKANIRNRKLTPSVTWKKFKDDSIYVESHTIPARIRPQ